MKTNCLQLFVTALVACLFTLGSTAVAQEVRTITGRVTEAGTDEPLVGATVFIAPDETSAKDYKPQGTVTDYDGNFLFTLPRSVQKVVVSYVGFVSQTITLSDKSKYTIRLEEDAHTMAEVVVTGYQKIERRKLTSAVTTVSASELTQVGAPSIDQLLVGQVPGMVITPVSGGPGAQSQVRIRGTVSLSGSSEPLWVLDGIPLDGDAVPKDVSSQDVVEELRNTSIAGLNPSDIESITVLKDAAATAIYGARAANGVIVITSKRGKEGKMRVNFSADLFYTGRPNADRLNLLNADKKVDLELALLAHSLELYRPENGDVARLLAGTDGALDLYKKGGFNALPAQLQSAINALRQDGTDWFREIYEPTVNHQYSLSLSGGGERARYYLSGGYYNETGTTKGTSFKRYNLTSNTDLTINDKLKASISIFANQSDKGTYLTNGANSSPQYYSRNVNPYRRVVDDEGEVIYDPDVLNSDNVRLDFNYREEQENTKYTLKNQSVKTVMELEYKPIDALRLTTQFGLQFENNGTEKFADAASFFTRQYRQSYRAGQESVLPEGGIIQNWNDRFFQYNWRNQLFFQKMFGENHDIDFMAGVELRRNSFTSVHTKGFGYDPASMTTKPVVFPKGFNGVNSTALRQYQKRFVENAFVSFFSTASYTYKGRYTLFGSIRYDGSNLFGVDPKYRYLPLWSVSAAWDARREEFIKDLSWISNLKVRASYGLQGNIDKETSPFVKGEWNNSNIYKDVTIPIISVTAPPNQNLRWEKTSTTNAGFDFGLFDRLNIAFDYYYRLSSDLISQKAIPSENGFDYVSLNWGEVENRGWELAINTVNIRTKDFTWTTGLNIAQNKSKVTQFNARENSFTPSLEGYPVNAQFAIPTAGLDDKGNMMFRTQEGKVVGYRDFYNYTNGVFGDLIPPSAEQYRKLFVYMGDKDPKWTGGISTTLRYKKADLAIYGNFFLDKVVSRQPAYNPTQVDPGVNYTEDILSSWSLAEKGEATLPKFLSKDATGDDQDIYQWINSYDSGRSFYSYDIWFKKMSYLRISSIRLGYTFDQEVLKKAGVQSIRLNLEARNPFVFSTDYSGYFDPESYGNIYAQPMARTFSIGFQVSL